MEGDLTPMIDMTFQLIAFFMIIMNFSKVDRAEEIMLPVSALAKPPETVPEFQVILNLDSDGSVKTGGLKFDEIDDIGSHLDREITAAEREQVSVGNISVVIRAHQDTRTGTVQKLIAKCQEDDLQNFVLRVKEDR